MLGVEGRPVSVELHVSNGLPGFSVVGMPDATCREARDRVRAAVMSSELKWPDKKVIVNLSPPGAFRKVGTALDLPIALALLVADGQLGSEELGLRACIGELGLDGSLRPVKGALSLVDALEAEEIIVPESAVAQARLIGRHKLRTAPTLGHVVAALQGVEPWPELPPPQVPAPPHPDPDLADVRGQPAARYALEVAAAGGHHVLLVGAPGAGKSMLARRLVGLLPDLPLDQALEVTRIHSVAGVSLPDGDLVRRPPYRAPHHSASPIALVGGGTAALHPGELSVSHRGVLFLDELGEFNPIVLENLRQPLEEGVVRLARAATRATFPSRVLLVAAMNPCPCGEGMSAGACRCSPAARLRYSRRLSAPLLDRFDLRIPMARPSADELLAAGDGEPTHLVATRVAAARARARMRGIQTNSELAPWQLDDEAPLDRSATYLVERQLAKGLLTGRGLAAVRRVALSIADLRGDELPLNAQHVGTALALRADLRFVTGWAA